eukprot:XP_011420943.1 PREDICTED: uncharacterized protein LOC105323585 isoform X1 [Crassostrea gigas]
MSQLGHFGIFYLFAVFVWGVSSRQLSSRLDVPTSISTSSTSARPSTYYNFLTNRWITATTKGPSHPYSPTWPYNYLTNRWITPTTKGPSHPYSPAWPYNFFTNRWITTTTKGPSHPYPATSSFKYNYLTNQWKISTISTNPQKTIPYSYSKSQWIGEPSVSPTASRGPQYSTTTAEKILPNDATLLHQILIQETSLRIELQKTVWDLMKDFEQMKKNQIEEKSDQDTINRQLINNITSLRSENKKLKDELLVLQQQTPNKSSNTGLHSYHDFTNVSKELQSFKREFRYFSLGFLDIQQDIDRINTQQENVTTAMKDIQDVKDILVRIQHKQFEFSTDLENLRTNQTDMLVRVAFTATRTQSQSFTTETTLVFSNALTNIGGGYRL